MAYRKEYIAAEHKAWYTAICPGCNVKHHVLIMWLGNGNPRIYCSKCKNIMGRIGHVREYQPWDE